MNFGYIINNIIILKIFFSVNLSVFINFAFCLEDNFYERHRKVN